MPQLKVIDMPGHSDRNAKAVARRYMLESGALQHKDKARVFTTHFDTTTMNIVKTYKRISVDAAEWLDRQPYQVMAPIERWKHGLVSAGAITQVSAGQDTRH